MEGSRTTAAAAVEFNAPPERELHGAYELYKRATTENINRVYGGKDAFLATGFAKVLELEGGDKERAYKAMDEIIHAEWNAVVPEIQDYFKHAASRYRGMRLASGAKVENVGSPTPAGIHHDTSSNSDTDDDMQIGLWLSKIKSRRPISGKKPPVRGWGATTNKPASFGTKAQGKKGDSVKGKRKTQELGLSTSVGDSAKKDKDGCHRQASRSEVPLSSTLPAKSRLTPAENRHAQEETADLSSASGPEYSDADWTTGMVDGDAGGASPAVAAVSLAPTRQRSSGHQHGQAAPRGRSGGKGIGPPQETAGTASRTRGLPTTKGNGSKRGRSTADASSPTSDPSESRVRKTSRKSAPPPSSRFAELKGPSIALAQPRRATSCGLEPRVSNILSATPEGIASTRGSAGIVDNEQAAATEAHIISGSMGYPGKGRMVLEKESRTPRASRKSGAGSGRGFEIFSSEAPVSASMDDRVLDQSIGEERKPTFTSYVSSSRTKSSASSVSTSMALDSWSASPHGAVAAVPGFEEKQCKKMKEPTSIGDSETHGALVVLQAPKVEEGEKAAGDTPGRKTYQGSNNPEGRRRTIAVATTPKTVQGRRTSGSTEGSPNLAERNEHPTEGKKLLQERTKRKTTMGSQVDSYSADNAPLGKGQVSKTAEKSANCGEEVRSHAYALVVPASWTPVSVTFADTHAEDSDTLGTASDREGEDFTHKASSGGENVDHTVKSRRGRTQAHGMSSLETARIGNSNARFVTGPETFPASSDTKCAGRDGQDATLEENADYGSAADAACRSTIEAAYANARAARRRLVKRARRNKGGNDDANAATEYTRTVEPTAGEEKKCIPKAVKPKDTEEKGVRLTSTGPNTPGKSGGTRNEEEVAGVNGHNVFGLPCEEKVAIEVLWEIEDKTSGKLGGKNRMGWFDAFVNLVALRGIDEDGRREWDIVYSQRRSPLNKYQPIRRKKSYIVFLSNDFLRDAESDEPLRWREKNANHEKDTPS